MKSYNEKDKQYKAKEVCEHCCKSQQFQKKNTEVMEREIQTNSIERLNTAISYAALVLGLLNSNQFNAWRQMHTTGMNAEVSQNRKNFDAALQSYTLYIARKVILI